jgi:mRNA interferase RelE/StbE
VAYRIDLLPEVERTLAAFPQKLQRRIAGRIDALADDPRPPHYQKLSSSHAIYRIRVGNYRILYQIHEEVLTVLIVRIGDRKEVYRQIPGQR